MPDLIINPQFRDVTRPLKPEEYALLERNILSDGRVHSAIITWKNQIVDGHNRWSIIQKHLDVLGDKYGVQEMDFADEWEVIAWICNNQLGRRNLTDEERAFLIYQENEAEKNTVKNSTGVNQYTKEVWCQNGAKPKERTAQRIAKRRGVGTRTINRAVQFGKGVETANSIQPGAKERILSGETKAPKSVIAALPNMDTEQQREVVEKLMSGEPWKKKPTTRKKDPENDPDNVPETEPEDVAESDPDDNVENKCGRPVVDEAELFTAQNGEATPVLANEKLKAEFNTGKPGVTEMVRACESIGMFVDFTPRNKAMYHIKAVKTVYDIHGKLGYDGLVDVLSIIKDAWAGSPDSLTREILSGVALFYSTYSGQFQRKRLVDKLKKVDPVSIVREARSITSRGAVGTARVILRTYNANASQKTYIEGRI